MYHRQTTPNAPITTSTRSPASAASAHSRTTSLYSTDNSPASVVTHLTTPPRSPVHFQYGGCAILPKTRVQDQITEPCAAPVRQPHRRSSSAANVNFSAGYHPYNNSRPASLIRRGTSPPSTLSTPASVSVPSPYDAAFHSGVNSPVDFGPALNRRASIQAGGSHSRSSSASGFYSHKRSGSNPQIDESMISRFAFPTYRTMPGYVTSVASAAPNYVTAPPPSLSINTTMQPYTYNYEQMAQMSEDYSVPDLSPAPAVQYPYATEMQYDMFQQTAQTTTLLDYLTDANPAPSLVRRVAYNNRALNSHFWWDVRNLRSWTDFTISKMTSHDDFMKLLNLPIPSTSLPIPARTSSHPDSESNLHDIITGHYVTKLNAALQVTQGDKPMVMRSFKTTPGARQPDFVSNYDRDYDNTIFGDKRGRVVGLVKSYETWNTGMRAEAPNKQIHYLEGLAHLHRVMREHGCRYGFIITEIEMLCVRCGGPPSAASTDTATVNATGSVPLFGYLELSTPITLATKGVHPETGEPQLTAGMALWYLHMMARETPLPGTMYWKMDVGGPSALTRQNAVERDTWIPKPNMSEKRKAKSIRGWMWPEDPWSRKERVGRDGGRKSRD